MHTHSPQMSYARPEAPQRQPRDLEYDLLARASQRIQSAWPQKTARFAEFIAALDENEQLWRTLASDVASNDNALPSELRARLFYLYEFVSQHSAALREGNGSADVLVDINTAVMRGLRGQMPAAPRAKDTAA